MTPAENLRLLHRVLSAIGDETGALLLTAEADGSVRAALDTTGIFSTDCADDEVILPANIAAMEKAAQEVAARFPYRWGLPSPTPDRARHLAIVFASRQRGRKPLMQDGVYPVDARMMPVIADLPDPPGSANLPA